MVAQAAVGYTQYFTHLPALLVEVHLLGATVLVIGAVQCFLACTFHAPEVVRSPAAERPAAAGRPDRRPIGLPLRPVGRCAGISPAGQPAPIV
jgi:cytochrome c oxidase assembly protein subunit 15